MRRFFYFILFVGILTTQYQGFSQGTSKDLIHISHESGHYENPFYLKASAVEGATLLYAKGLSKS